MTARAHARYHGFNAAQTTEKVRFHDLAEEPYWHLFHRSSSTTYACVIHENVNATVLCKHLIDRIGYGTVVIHIERGYVTGRPSAETIVRSSLPPSKFLIVAITLWPSRASVTAVANPMPLLVPVTNAMATFASLGLYGDVKNSSRTANWR